MESSSSAVAEAVESRYPTASVTVTEDPEHGGTVVTVRDDIETVDYYRRVKETVREIARETEGEEMVFTRVRRRSR